MYNAICEIERRLNVTMLDQRLIECFAWICVFLFPVSRSMRNVKKKIKNNNNNKQQQKSMSKESAGIQAARCLYVLFFSFYSLFFFTFLVVSLHSTRWDSVLFSYYCCTSLSYWFFFLCRIQNYCIRRCVCIFVFSSTTVILNIMIVHRTDLRYICRLCACVPELLNEWVNSCVLCVYELCENEIQDETEQRHRD